MTLLQSELFKSMSRNTKRVLQVHLSGLLFHIKLCKQVVYFKDTF